MTCVNVGNHHQVAFIQPHLIDLLTVDESAVRAPQVAEQIRPGGLADLGVRAGDAG
jgi:hypothetical protein